LELDIRVDYYPQRYGIRVLNQLFPKRVFYFLSTFEARSEPLTTPTLEHLHC